MCDEQVWASEPLRGEGTGTWRALIRNRTNGESRSKRWIDPASVDKSACETDDRLCNYGQGDPSARGSGPPTRKMTRIWRDGTGVWPDEEKQRNKRTKESAHLPRSAKA